jgi:hypothetical protein
MKLDVTPSAEVMASPRTEREIRASHWAVCHLFRSYLGKESPDYEEFKVKFPQNEAKFYRDNGVEIPDSLLRTLYAHYLVSEENPYRKRASLWNLGPYLLRQLFRRPSL